MKANEVRPTSGAPAPRNATAPKGAFAKVLEEGKPEPAPALLPNAPVTPAVEEAAPVARTAAPQDLDNLAREMGAALRVNDGKEIEIRFDSKTFAGLEVRLRKEDGKLNVKLRSDSPEINRMLAGQSEALAQRLEARGYAGVRVELHAEPRPATFSEPRSRGGQGGQSGQGRQDQQKQRQR